MQKKVMPVISKYAGNYKHLINLGRILAAISALLMLVPYTFIWKIIKVVVTNGDMKTIPTIAWQAVGLVVLAMFIYVCALMCTHTAAFRVQANMRTLLMRHIVKLPLGVFDDEGTGKIRRIVNESTAATETFIAHTLPDKAVASVTPVGLIILMLVFDWKIGLICMIPSLIGFICLGCMMSGDMQKKMAEYQNSLEIMSSEATEYVRGIPVVKTFGQTVYTFKRFKKALDDYSEWVISYTKELCKFMVGFMTGINATFVALVFAAYIFSKGGVTPELILSLMYYIIITPLLTVTLSKMAYSGEAEMTLMDSIGRVENILNITPLEDSKENIKLDNFNIELQDVHYAYPGAEREAISGLTMRIKEGEHVAMVGPSGGGKTTAAQLISRFFDVGSGCITIGGVDVRKIPSQTLMNHVSFVFQDSSLLKGSILENVRLGKPDASEKEVMEALEKAQCMDIIEKFPDGIHTVIGSAGVYVSGGEAQRLSIARAMLKNAPILILDEATAFADPDNETLVQKAFEELSKGKTMIMIAHRLSTVVNADHIFVVKDGTCVESGKHKELMEMNGLYASMFEEYNRSVKWNISQKRKAGVQHD